LILNASSLSDTNTFAFEKYVPVNVSLTDENGEIEIYPNPAYDNLTISIPVEGLHYSSIVLVNHLGQEMKKMVVSEKLTSMDISDLSKGVYFLKIKTDRVMQTIKFIKK